MNTSYKIVWKKPERPSVGTVITGVFIYIPYMDIVMDIGRTT